MQVDFTAREELESAKHVLHRCAFSLSLMEPAETIMLEATCQLQATETETGTDHRNRHGSQKQALKPAQKQLM
jgi:hypothetical protein